MRFLIVMLAAMYLPAQAASFRLDAQGNEALFQSRLPIEVYQHARSNGLGDLTVKNAADEQVPYALVAYEALYPQNDHHVESKPLLLFRIKEDALQSPRGLQLKLEQGNAKTTVEMNASEDSGFSKQVFLLDAGKKHPPLQTLKIDWQGIEDKLLSLEISSSDDLKNWNYAGSGVLLKTQTSGNNLLANTITLDLPTKARYLQIRPTTSAPNVEFRLTKAVAEYGSKRTKTPPLLWHQLTFLNREPDDKNRLVNLDFETSGRFPASYLHLKLPQENTITRASILVRDKESEPWHFVDKALFYQILLKGKTYTNADVVINPQVARYWRIQFNLSDGGIGKENPEFSLGWPAQTLVWNARGKAPYTVQVGEKPKYVNRVELASLMPDDQIEKVQQLPNANLSIEVSADMDNKVENVWTAPPDYKRWWLWGGLMLGVLILAGMVYSLLGNREKH